MWSKDLAASCPLRRPAKAYLSCSERGRCSRTRLRLRLRSPGNARSVQIVLETERRFSAPLQADPITSECWPDLAGALHRAFPVMKAGARSSRAGSDDVGVGGIRRTLRDPLPRGARPGVVARAIVEMPSEPEELIRCEVGDVGRRSMHGGEATVCQQAARYRIRSL